MTFRVHFYTVLSFQLFILSFQAFPLSHVLEGDLRFKWIEQNSLNYFAEGVRMLHDKKIIPDAFCISEQRKPLDIVKRKYFGIDENGNPTNPNPTYGQAYRYQQPMSVRLGIEVGF